MEYQYIVNPQTGRKCKTNSRLGRQLIKNYTIQNGGTTPSRTQSYECQNCNKLRQEIATWRGRAETFHSMLQDCYSKLNDTEE